MEVFHLHRKREQYGEYETKKKWILLGVIVAAVVVLILASTLIVPAVRYNKAEKLRTAGNLGGRKDSARAT